jgi:hypothetical protein
MMKKNDMEKPTTMAGFSNLCFRHPFFIRKMPIVGVGKDSQYRDDGKERIKLP